MFLIQLRNTQVMLKRKDQRRVFIQLKFIKIEYLDKLKEQNEDDFNKQFSKWNKCLTDAKLESCEDLFIKIHEGIRADPAYKGKTRENKKPVYTDARKTIVK